MRSWMGISSGEMKGAMANTLISVWDLKSNQPGENLRAGGVGGECHAQPHRAPPAYLRTSAPCLRQGTPHKVPPTAMRAPEYGSFAIRHAASPAPTRKQMLACTRADASATHVRTAAAVHKALEDLLSGPLAKATPPEPPAAPPRAKPDNIKVGC